MNSNATLIPCRSGDSQAVDDLLSRYYARVQIIIQRAMAQDPQLKRPWPTAMFSTGGVVQEVFRGVLPDPGDFEGETEASLVAPLAARAKSRIIGAIRLREALRRDPRRASAKDLDPAAAHGPQDPAEIAQLNDEVTQAADVMNTLPSHKRLLLQERSETQTTFSVLVEQLGDPSEDAARRAFYSAQAGLLIRLHGVIDGGVS